jgi:hypothetical protein
MLAYVIISGIVLAIALGYRVYVYQDNVTLLDVIMMMLFGLMMGFILLPLLLILSLDRIKLK